MKKTLLTTAIALTVLGAGAYGCVADPPGSLAINTTGGTSGDTSTSDSSTTGPGAGSGGGGTQSGKDYYVENVDPLLQASCASCHATGTNGAPIFMVANNGAGTYNAMVNYPKHNLVTKPKNTELILHGEHSGPALTTEEHDAIVAWLKIEFAGDGQGGGGGGSGTQKETLQEALIDFGGCETYDDWMSTGMTELPKMQVAGGDTCTSCHSAGQNGTWLNSADDMETWSMNRDFPYIMRLATGTVDANADFKDLVPAKRFIEKGQEACNTEPCHPKFQLPQSLLDAVNNYFDLSYAHWKQGNCGGGGSGGGGGGAP